MEALRCAHCGKSEKKEKEKEKRRRESWGKRRLDIQIEAYFVCLNRDWYIYTRTTSVNWRKGRLKLQLIPLNNRVRNRRGFHCRLLFASYSFFLSFLISESVLSMVSQLFEEKAKAVNELPTKPTTEELLKLYALYKQATIGDCNTERPGVFNFKDRSKWDAWNNLKGMSQEEAEKEYIAFVDELFEKYGSN